MLRSSVLALAVATAISFPHAVMAADLLATYDGFITGENAGDTIFGGHAALGDPISAAFYYSTSVPDTRTTTLGVSDEVRGSLNFGTDPVISRAIFTSGAYTFSYTPDYYTDVYTSPGFLNAYAYDTLGNSSQTYIVPDAAAPTDLETPFTSSGIGDGGGPTTQYSFVSDGNTTIDFDATRIVVSAAPEPGIWALMLAGVGLMGLMLRRRRQDALSA